MIDIDVINNKLSEGLTVKEVRDQLNIGEKKFQKEIKELGYKYNQKLKKYMKSSEPTREVLKTSLTNYSSDKNKKLREENYKEKYDNSMIIDIPGRIEADTFKSNLIDLVLNYDKIKKMMYDYEHTSGTQENIIEVQQQGIKIDKPEGNIIRTTVRVNEEILERFKAFCDNHKEYTQKDLLGQALLEFIERHDR